LHQLSESFLDLLGCRLRHADRLYHPASPGRASSPTATSQEDIKEVTFAYGRTADGGFKIYTSVRSEAEPLT
jgi:hypothetical protein